MNITKLCSTLSGIDVPLLTITDFDDTNTLIESRKLVIISGKIRFFNIYFILFILFFCIYL